MAKFIDANGTERDIRLTVGSLTDVQDQTGVDLEKSLAGGSELASLLYSSPGRFVSVLYVLTGATDEPKAFARGFDGPTLERAADAFCRAVADFFPRQRVAAALRERVDKIMSDLDDHLIRSLHSSS